MGKNTDKIFNDIYSSRSGRSSRRAQHKWEEKNRKLKERHNKYKGTSGKESAKVINTSLTDETMAPVNYDPQVGGVARVRPEHMDSVTPDLNDKELTPAQQNKNNGMQPLRLIELNPDDSSAISALQIGGEVQMGNFGRGSLDTDGNTNHSRLTTYQALSADGLPTAGQQIDSAKGAFASGATGGQNGAQTMANDGPISQIIRANRAKTKFYFPNLANTRLKKLLSDMNAYVRSRGRDNEFFNFGVIRDVDAAMRGGGGRAKGSNHGFGLAIDALHFATNMGNPDYTQKAKKYTVNGQLTDKVKGNYHDRNKVIIQDFELMKILHDFSNLPENSDIYWGGWMKRGDPVQVTGVGTLYTMELHHWEIAKSAIPQYWEPYMSHLKRNGINSAPVSTSQNLAAMQALWNEYTSRGQSQSQSVDSGTEEAEAKLTSGAE